MQKLRVGALIVSCWLGRSMVFAAPPVVTNDFATGWLAETVLIDVLANDVWDGLTLVWLTDPANWSAIIVENQASYQPDEHFCGTGTFVYTVQNNLAEQATWLVTVISACGLVAVDDYFSTPIDTPVLITTSEVRENDVLAFYGVEWVRRDVEYWDPFRDVIATDNGLLETQWDLTMLYTPDEGFCGLDQFEYEIRIIDRNSESTVYLDTGMVTIDVECPAFCGDGEVDPWEQCDDWNNDDGDWCSSTCQIEIEKSGTPSSIVLPFIDIFVSDDQESDDEDDDENSDEVENDDDENDNEDEENSDEENSAAVWLLGNSNGGAASSLTSSSRGRVANSILERNTQNLLSNIDLPMVLPKTWATLAQNAVPLWLEVVISIIGLWVGFFVVMKLE